MKVETLEDAPIATTDPSIMRIHADHVSNHSAQIRLQSIRLCVLVQDSKESPLLSVADSDSIRKKKKKRKLAQLPNLTLIESSIIVDRL